MQDSIRTANGPTRDGYHWFEWVFKEHYNELRAFVQRYVSADDIADDVIQDLFVSIWQNLGRWYESGDALRPLLFVAARNHALDHLRASRVRERYAKNVVGSDVIQGMVASPIDDLLHGEVESQMDTAIASLPPRAREIFLLSRREGLTYRQIAEHLNLSAKTVENQIGIALARLRKLLVNYLAILAILQVW